MLSKISVKHDKNFGPGWTQSVPLACVEGTEASKEF
jgi:hypothetical protein